MKSRTAAPSTNLAMSRYLIVVVIFAIVGFVALIAEREFLFGSAKARRNRHLHDHHLAYSSEDENNNNYNDKNRGAPLIVRGRPLEKKFDDSNPPDPENFALLKEMHCIIHGPSEHLELIDLGYMTKDHEHDASEKLREKVVDITKEFHGKVTLFSNVASKCGYTKLGYEALVKLYDMFEDEANLKPEYQSKFRIAAIPSNDFGGQEPGTVDEIRQFASKNFGAKFHIYQKAKVRGPNTIPLFKKLTRCAPESLNAAANKDENARKSLEQVTWNWNFFLVDQYGRVVARFPPGTDAAKMARVIEPLLLR